MQRKEITLYFPQTTDAWPHPWSKASTHVAVDREDRHFHNEGPPLPSSSFLHLLLPSVTSYGMEYHFGCFRSASLVMFLPHLLPTPSLLSRGWVGRRLEGVLIQCQYCSAADTTLVWYQCYSSYMCRAQHCMGSCRESLNPSQTQYNLHPLFHNICVTLRSHIL